MIPIIHRINNLDRLKSLPSCFGVEIDVRGYGDRILLNHDPISGDPDRYVDLEDYLRLFSDKNMAFVVFNIKEAGYEQRVVDCAKHFGIGKDKYFLLDVEFPYLYHATRSLGMREIAVRYSEAEPIEAVEAQIHGGKTLLDWVWIDTNTLLPLDRSSVSKLKPFKTCLVCPSRWNRQDDIPRFGKQMQSLKFKPDAVMTSEEHVALWESLIS